MSNLAASLKKIKCGQIDWPSVDRNEHKGVSSQLGADVLERLLLVEPLLVLEKPDGRYQALTHQQLIVESLSQYRSRNLSIRCLLVNDGAWDTETWAAFIDHAVPWLRGRMTSKEKRETRKILHHYDELASITKPQKKKTQAARMTQKKSES